MVANSEIEWVNYQIALDLGYTWLRDQNGELHFPSFRWKNEHQDELVGWEMVEEPDVLQDVPEFDKNYQLLYEDYSYMIKALMNFEE